MNATKQRDAVAHQAKTDSSAALQSARNISDPWFRAQALAHVARYSKEQSREIADQAAAAAEDCPDAYKQCAVRAWEIAALAERSDCRAAFARLKSVLSKIGTVVPPSSRSEALSLLLHAAARIGIGAAQDVAAIIVNISNKDSHWRCQRATVDAIGVVQRLSPDSALSLSEKVSDVKLKGKCDKIMAAGGTSPRKYFW